MGTVEGGEEVVRGSEERINVSVRLRPLNGKEIFRHDVADWDCINDNTVIYKNVNVSASDRSMYPTAYTFDRVFRPDCSTREVYERAAKNVAISVVSGMNSSVFAYGQTSSGKTFTMTGVTEYAIADIYEYIQKHPERDFVLKFSALEIYNESVRDLLSVDSTPLRLLDDPERGTVVEKLTEETIRDWDHVIQLLSVCEAERQIGETSLNEVSSRSHQIIRLTVESSPRDFIGRDNASALAAAVNFVDLAGSERASQANSAGTRLKEGCHINRSLLTLGTVIRKLSKGRGGHIPYRDSKLTRILQTSLGGNARTAIICTMSPARSHVEQSRNTLLFASCAKEVTTNAKVNVVMSDKALVKYLQRELTRLESELRNYQSTVSTPNYPAMLREKDLQITKLEEKINDLTLQRDVAQSHVKDLLEIIGNEASLTRVGSGHYPHLRVQRSPDSTIAEEETRTPHSLGTCSGGHSRTSSDDQIVKVPYFDDDFVPSNSPPRILASNSSDSYSNHDWEEIEKESSGASEDICREVRCIEAEEFSNKVATNCDSVCSEENTEFPHVEVYVNGHAQTMETPSTPFENNQVIKSSPMENDCAMEEEEKEHEEKDSSSPPSKEQREVSSIHSPEFPSHVTQLNQDSPLASFFKLTKSRSCRARIADSNSPWHKMMDFSEITSSFGSERGYVDFEKKFSPWSFSPFVRDLSRKDSQCSPDKTFDIEIDAPNEKLPTQDIHTKNQSMATVPEADESPKRDVKDVGLDPIVDEFKGLSNWPAEFRRLQREIVELWHACNVSLIHRSYFFMLFQGGDPSDAIYMEVEMRRMKFLRDKFSRGENTVVNGQCLTLALSLKALREERRMLSKRMSKKLSEQERESLFLKWGIGLDTKLRRLQLSYRLWTKTDDMDHVADSAFLVAKLVSSMEHGQTHHKEMFGLNFTPRRSTRSHNSFRRSLISFL
ncbi:kinesin-like protein KIN-7E [Salvia miltiorrhiza]|uniref:kinesin-like protein KIN-7E n=1 Tax=Salvia miltiorrhiza TaxID=226208 RepID=UPI0025AD157F|nr:kinesin-like protein KIN-7E [Salvia miltiorrhiza]